METPKVKVIGRLKCTGCGRMITRNLLAAYGLEEQTFNCPSCGALHVIDDADFNEEGELVFTVRKDAGFRLQVMALIVPPGDKKDPLEARTVVPLDVDLEKAIPLGLSMFDTYDRYVSLREATFERFVYSPYSTIYGQNTIGKIATVIPLDVYRQVGHVRLLRFFKMFDELIDRFRGWITERDKTGKPIKITMAVIASLSLMGSSMFLADYANSRLDSRFNIQFLEGVFDGFRFKDKVYSMAFIPIDQPVITLIQRFVDNQSEVIEELTAAVAKQTKSGNKK